MFKCDLCDKDSSIGMITHKGKTLCIECVRDVVNIVNKYVDIYNDNKEED